MEQEPETGGEVRKAVPTVSVYQNSEYVAGILQQLFNQPLLVTEVREGSRQRNFGRRTNHATRVAGEAKARFGFAGIGASDQYDYGSQADEGSVVGDKSNANYLYSTAYYLHLVRNALQDRGLLRSVTGPESAADLRTGDLIEYTCRFFPNELQALLDIASPDLIGQIFGARARLQGNEVMRNLPHDVEHERLVRVKELHDAKAVLQSDLARAVTTAFQVDFRSETTREFYGDLSDQESILTAITICESEHFVVKDFDRLLDGEFTVLGKVTSSLESGVPILERNKLLHRVQPEAVDYMFNLIQETVSAQGRRLEDTGQNPAPQGADLLDLELSSRIKGDSFRVLPIAIYA